MTHVRTRPKPLCSLPLRRSRTLPADLVLNPWTIRRTFSFFSLLLINNVITYAAFEVSVEVIHNDTNESCSDVTENLQKNPTNQTEPLRQLLVLVLVRLWNAVTNRWHWRLLPYQRLTQSSLKKIPSFRLRSGSRRVTMETLKIYIYILVASLFTTFRNDWISGCWCWFSAKQTDEIHHICFSD